MTVAWAVTVAVTVAWGVVGAARGERVGVADGEEAAGELGARVAEAETETETETETEALAVDGPADGLLVPGCVVAADDPPPAGDGVWGAWLVAEPDDDVNGVGVKVDGTEEPPGEQAATATVSRTAPAARRPAASHASRVAAGVLSRIFMDPPRTRVRCTR